MLGLRKDCNVIIRDGRSYIIIKDYFIPIPWHIALVFSFLTGELSIVEVADIIVSVGLMSEFRKKELLSEIRKSYMVFLEEYQPGCVRKDIPKPEEILNTTREKISVFDYPIPRAMLYHVTSSCDKYCRYCYLNAHKSPLEGDILSREGIFKIIDQMRDLAIPKIVYTGGEPFVRKDFLDILEYASKKGIYNSVTTKHYFTSGEAIRIGKMGMVKIALSYDSHIPCEADYLSGCVDHARKMDTSITYLLENNVDLSIEPVVTGVNVNSIEAFLVHLKKLGVENVELHRYVNDGGRHNEQLNLTAQQWDNILGLLNSSQKSLTNLCLYNESVEIKQSENASLETGCVNGLLSFSMLPNGKVVLCDHMPNAKEYCYGDLKTQSIEEIWNGDSRREILNPSLENFMNTPCETCHDFMQCLKKTACRKQSILQCGDINGISTLTRKLCSKFT